MENTLVFRFARNTTLIAAFVVAGAAIIQPPSSSVLARSVDEDPFDRPLVKCWTFEAAEAPIKIFSSDESGFYLQSQSTHTLFRLDSATGLVDWEVRLGAPIRHIAINRVLDPVIALEGPEGSLTVRALSKKSGITLWQRVLSTGSGYEIVQTRYEREAPSESASADRIVAVADDGRLMSVDIGSGILQDLGRIKAGKDFKGVLLGDKLVFSGTEGWDTFDFNGDPPASFRRTDGEISSMAPIGSGRLAVGYSSGRLELIRLGSSGQVWTFKAGGAVDFVSASPGAVIAGSKDNFLYSFDSLFGTLHWKRRFSGRLLPPSIHNRLAAVAVTGESSVEIVDLRNGRKINGASFEEVVTDYTILEDSLIVSTASRVAALSSRCSAKTKGPGK